MTADVDLTSRVSPDELQRLLAIHGESDNLDFKASLDLATTRGKTELARDILALANTPGGGHLVIGVEDGTFIPVGLGAESGHIDTTAIHKALSRYITAHLRIMAAEYALPIGAQTELVRMAIIYVAPYEGIAVPTCDLKYSDRSGDK